MNYPELIYLYIENNGYCLKEQEFKFSSNYSVQYNEDRSRKLFISPKENPLREIYGEHIVGISLLVGENGSGKTSILELLMELRQTASKWFCVYALDIPHSDSDNITYYIEGTPILISNLSIPQHIDKNKFYSCCASFKEDSLHSFNRGSINNKLQMYYRPVVQREAAMVIQSQGKLMKKAISQPNTNTLFEFICYNHQQLSSVIHAKNVEFYIKLKSQIYPEKQNDLHHFTDNKSLFLINLRIYQLAELKNQHIFSKDVDEIILALYPGLKQQLDPQKTAEYVSSYPIERVQLSQEYHKVLCQITGLPREELTSNITAKIETHVSALVDFINIPAEFFPSPTECILPIREEYMFENMSDLIEYVDNSSQKSYSPITQIMETSFIQCKFRNLSHGEEAFFRFFSSLQSNIFSTFQEDNDVYDTKILLLDEPDLSMHPEWSRRFLYDMQKIISTLYVKKRTKFQIIVATHSPFMVSDVPKDNIICLEKNLDGNIHVRPSKYGLLSNIHDICSDSFFIKSTFGKLGSEIFTTITQMIENLSSIQDRDNICKIEAYISEIGDIVLKGHLKIQFQMRLEHLKALNTEQKNSFNEVYSYDVLKE